MWLPGIKVHKNQLGLLLYFWNLNIYRNFAKISQSKIYHFFHLPKFFHLQGSVFSFHRQINVFLNVELLGRGRGEGGSSHVPCGCQSRLPQVMLDLLQTFFQQITTSKRAWWAASMAPNRRRCTARSICLTQKEKRRGRGHSRLILNRWIFLFVPPAACRLFELSVLLCQTYCPLLCP